MALSNFSWLIPGRLAGSDIPGHGSIGDNFIYNDIKELSSFGIKFLVSLSPLPISIEEICKELGIEWRCFLIPDFCIPQDYNDFNLLIDDIIVKMKRNVSVCVHCHAGIGRTGMVLSCVIGRWFSLGGKKAIEAVKRSRDAIETEEQTQFVLTFLGEYEY